jgi:hypothetical protein
MTTPPRINRERPVVAPVRQYRRKDGAYGRLERLSERTPALTTEPAERRLAKHLMLFGGEAPLLAYVDELRQTGSPVFVGHTSSLTGVPRTPVSMIEPEHIHADVVPVLSHSPTAVRAGRHSSPSAAPFFSETAPACFPSSLQSCSSAAGCRSTQSHGSVGSPEAVFVLSFAGPSLQLSLGRETAEHADGYEGEDYHIHLAHGEPPEAAIEEASALLKVRPDYDHYSDLWYWEAEDAPAAHRLLDTALTLAERGFTVYTLDTAGRRRRLGRAGAPAEDTRPDRRARR